MIDALKLTPSELAVGDKVLLNEGWWNVRHVSAKCLSTSDVLGPSFHSIRLWHGHDVLTVRRDSEEPLTVNRLTVDA